MLYSGENGNTTSFRGKTWRLTNGYTRACNYKGQQCTFKNQNEALRFANKDKPINEDTSAILKRNMTSRSGTGLDRKIFKALERLQAGENLSLREKQWVVKQLQDNVPHTALIKVWKDVRKSSMRGGNRNDGSRAIEGIIDAALDGQKAGLGQAHHGPSNFGEGNDSDDPQQSNRGALPKWARDPKYAKKKYLDKFKDETNRINEAFSLDDLEAMSTPGLRRMLASWEKRAKASPHNQPIWDNIEAIKDALQFKRSIGETNRINEGPRQPGQRVSGKAPKSMPDRSAFDAIKPGSRVTFRMKRHGVVRGVADRYNRRNDSWHADVLVGDETGIVTRDNFVALGSNKPSMGKGPWKDEVANEAMGSSKPVTVYAKDRKTVLGTVSKQSSSVGASKVAGGSVQQARVNGYLSWVRK